MDIHQILQDFLRAKAASRKSPRTIEWYASQLGRWVDWLDTKGKDWLAPESFEEYFVYETERGLSDRSLEAHYVSAKALFTWLRKRRPEVLNGCAAPTDIVERPKPSTKKPRQANYEDVCTLIRSIKPTTWLDYRDQALLQLLLSTGLRADEATALRTHDVDAQDRFIYVECGKGGKSRLVPYDQDFAQRFVAYIYNRPVGCSDRLFLMADHKLRPLALGLTTNGLRKMIHRRCNDARLAYINPHSFRHLFAMKALNDGVPLSAVSAMLGHTSVSFTAKVYARWVKAGLRREYDQHWQPMPETSQGNNQAGEGRRHEAPVPVW